MDLDRTRLNRLGATTTPAAQVPTRRDPRGSCTYTYKVYVQEETGALDLS
jgi:hypothetical protein